jgi:two-component system sensor histidine kinase TctE
MTGRRAASLQARLAWRLAVVLFGAIALVAVGMGWRAIRTIDTLRDESLQAQAADIARYLTPGPDGRGVLDLPPALVESYRRSGGSYIYAVLGPDGRVLYASSPAASSWLSKATMPTGQDGFFRIDNDTSSAGPFYGYLAHRNGLRVAVAQGSAHDDTLVDSLVQEYLMAAAWMILPLAALALWVSVMTVRDGLRPLTRASEQAAQIGPDRAELRLPLEDLPREVRPLVEAVNRAFDRLAKGFEVQRRFTANAAHELRTPLAVLTARIDELKPDPTSAALTRDIERMNRLVDQLLRISRLDTLPLNLSQRIDLRELTVETISGLAPLAVRCGCELAFSAPEQPVWVQGNAPALVTAITNLVENAIAYSPRDGTIEVEVRNDGSVRVMDEGPGVPEAERELIFQRFWRGRVGALPGSGLGLAIVSEIAQAHRGSVTVSGRSPRGAEFCLRLATVPAPLGPQA